MRPSTANGILDLMRPSAVKWHSSIFVFGGGGGGGGGGRGGGGGMGVVAVDDDDDEVMTSLAPPQTPRY